MLNHTRPTSFPVWMKSIESRLRRLDARVTRLGTAALPGYTSTEYAALTPPRGTAVYDTTNNKVVVYTGAAWVNVDGTAL